MRVSKSEVVYESLKVRINSGEFNTSLRLPSEQSLSMYYGCSRPTLRKALDMLENDKMIIRKQGSGSFLLSEGLDANHVSEIPERRRGMFGVLFPSLGENYVFDIIRGDLSRALSQRECSLVTAGVIVPGSATLREDIRRICAAYIDLRVDGVFLVPIEYTPLREELNQYMLDTFARANIPVVLIDSDYLPFPQRSSYDLVSLDHIQAGYLLTQHMIEQSARTIHFLSPPLSAHTIKMREIGYREALYDADIPVRSERVHECDPKNIKSIASILAFEPQGIICANDGTAILLLETMREIDSGSTSRVMVAGFDNLSYLGHIRETLTSISQPTERISNEAVSMMLERCSKPHRPCRTVRISGQLICRKSTVVSLDTR